VLAQASSSILSAHLKGADETRVRLLRDAVEAMLEGAQAPAKPFADYAALKGVAQHKNRRTCVLLPIDAVLGAFAVAEPLEITNPRPKRAKR
jgi:NifU-like protein involved in Fe-S cluster formation